MFYKSCSQFAIETHWSGQSLKNILEFFEFKVIASCF